MQKPSQKKRKVEVKWRRGKNRKTHSKVDYRPLFKFSYCFVDAFRRTIHRLEEALNKAEKEGRELKTERNRLSDNLRG